MKIRITGRGIYGAKEELAIGTIVEVKKEPKGWKGRYEVISGGDDGNGLIVNPQDSEELIELKKQADELGIEYRGNISAATLKARIDTKLAE